MRLRDSYGCVAYAAALVGAEKWKYEWRLNACIGAARERRGVQSILALWTPRFYGHPDNTDSS